MGWTVHIQVHESITDTELMLSVTTSATEVNAQSPRDVKQTLNKSFGQRSVGGVSLNQTITRWENTPLLSNTLCIHGKLKST